MEKGWCVDPNNEKALMRVVTEAINTDSLRKDYGKNAKSYFEENFSSKIVFDRLNKPQKNKYIMQKSLITGISSQDGAYLSLFN